MQQKLHDPFRFHIRYIPTPADASVLECAHDTRYGESHRCEPLYDDGWEASVFLESPLLLADHRCGQRRGLCSTSTGERSGGGGSVAGEIARQVDYLGFCFWRSCKAMGPFLGLDPEGGGVLDHLLRNFCVLWVRGLWGV